MNSMCCLNESLPKVSTKKTSDLSRRVQALKQLQLKLFKLNAEMEADIQKLRVKYADLAEPFFEKRYQIITGKHEPTDGECELVTPGVLGRFDRLKKKIFVPAIDTCKKNKCVPNFWLTVLKNNDFCDALIQKRDELALQSLKDIRVVTKRKSFDFTVEFHFSENDFFTNDVLTKAYYVECTVDKRDPWSYDGPTVVKTEGSTVTWKPNKNLTKGSGVQRSKQSFFNVFKPVSSRGNRIFDDYDDDYEFGTKIKDEVIPMAVLYYTGEKAEDEESSESSSSSDTDGESSSELECPKPKKMETRERRGRARK
ncbi:nucleosome assembly protein 1-like 4 isoform X2 [Leptotrombidium deliense]|uniref:Nucleosome assembly protein 1-like 4 isoform X2 n=1 Tax=Leptotrombidium deliense TaxID=299467 RepID=A0A443SJW7_9ACAR|nr:nucleosome assembly protein 1-like 4 isoform X2 [Leptotrombidium deliense]